MALTLALAPASGRAGVFDHFWDSGPPTLADVARMIDHIQNAILNQGTVVAKQPDIWSQARMTMFRKEFEDTMSPEVARFQDYLAARVARSDFASFQSQTALGAVLTPFGTPAGSTTPFTPAITTQDQLTSAQAAVVGATVKSDGTLNVPAIPAPDATPAATFSLLSASTPQGSVINSAGQLVANQNLNLGLEPNIHIDEKADYINHLHRLRRVNLGDDTADSAGYGLYLMRVPISIQPGDKTKKGFGAVVNITMRHEFGPKFLPETYHNLVVNDLIDLLNPVVHELIRNGEARRYHDAVQKLLKAKRTASSRYRGTLPANSVPPASEDARVAQDPAVVSASQAVKAMEVNLKSLSNFHPISRTGSRSYAIAPSDVKRVFVAQNLLNLAYAAQEALNLTGKNPDLTNQVKLTDLGTYLRHELEGAYAVMDGRDRTSIPVLQDVAYIEDLTDQVYSRKFEGPKGLSADSPEELDEFYTLYRAFTNRLPGNLRYRPIGVLAWGIALEAGLLNRQLREDMKQVKGADGFACPPEVDGMIFYVPDPVQDAVADYQ
jgi:hypothetical protein